MTIFPAQIDNSTTLPSAVDDLTPVAGAVVNRLRDAIVAVETELGVKPSAIYTTVRARLDSIETALDQVIAGGGGGGGSSVTFGGDLTGNNIHQIVTGLQSRPLSSAAPVNGQAIIWNGSAWAPATIPAGFSAGGDLSGNATTQVVIGLQGRSVSSAAPIDQQVLTWNATNNMWQPTTGGAAGPTGPTGPAGPAGPAGPQGPQGSPGVTGPGGSNTGLPSGGWGALWFQGPTSVTALAPGASGFILETQGSGANPVWIANTGGGGVTGPAGATGPTGPQGATGPAGITGATGPAGGLTASRLTPSDSNTTIYWNMDGSAPIANQGVGGALNLNTEFGSPSYNITGLFGTAVAYNASSGSNTASTTIEPSAAACTASCWVNFKAFVASGNIVNKEYRNDGTHNSPFNALQIGQGAGGAGQWEVSITVSGVSHAVNVTADPFLLPLNVWTFLSLTYDGATLSAYINGTLAASAAVAGSIDFGTHGPYGVGANGNGSSQSSDAIIDDVRVESIVRSQTYLQTMYKNGVGLFDSYSGVTGPTGPVGATGPAAALYGAYSGRPAPGVTGRLYITTDSLVALAVDSGITWQPLIEGQIEGIEPSGIVSGTYTGFNQGSSTITPVNGGYRFDGQNDGATTEIRGFAIPIASPTNNTFVEVAIQPLVDVVVSANSFVELLIGLRESSTAKSYVAGFGANYDTGSSTVQSNYMINEYWGSDTSRTAFGLNPYPLGNGPIFIRVRRTATTINSDVSRDRVLWRQVNSVAIGTVYTSGPNQIIICGSGQVTGGASPRFNIISFSYGF